MNGAAAHPIAVCSRNRRLSERKPSSASLSNLPVYHAIARNTRSKHHKAAITRKPRSEPNSHTLMGASSNAALKLNALPLLTSSQF